MFDSSKIVADYFKAKQRELCALSELAVCEHSGLKGGHREQIYRTYFSHLLPCRYSVGKGMVYGQFHRSHESDIVIWDSHSFPSLPLQDHSFYFAESVRAVIECKGRWNSEEFSDVLKKAKAVRDIVPHNDLSLSDELAQIQLDIVSLKTGKPHRGLMITSHHIGTAGIFLKGGSSAKPKSLIESCKYELDDAWPDLLIFLEPGLVSLKLYPNDDQNFGSILFFRYGEDALLAFSSALLKILDDRVVHSEGRFYLDRYAHSYLIQNPEYVHDFRLQRFVPGRTALWK